MKMTLMATLAALGSIWVSGVEKPVITPESGTTFDSTLTVTISCPSEGATIHFTTDGSEPTQESSLYNKRFRVTERTTVKARAFDAGGEGSEIATAEYALGRCPDPVIVSAGGSTFLHADNAVRITWRCPDGELHYTLDGSDVTAESPVYTGSFRISETTTVKAKAFGVDYIDSAEVSATLVRHWESVATPVIAAAASFSGSETKVEISCATPDATIRYTVDGSAPNAESPAYTGPFWVAESCTVRAYATCPDYVDSTAALFAIAKVWGIGDTMGRPDRAFATSGDKPFVRVTDATATQGEAMRSGAVADNQTSVLSTTVVGPGTVSFRWKTSCEEDEELHDWDRAVFAVDGVEVARQDGVTDWLDVSHAITNAGAHAVTWTYVKDDAATEGADCVWVADFAWTSDEPYTHETSVQVPYAWIREKLPHTPDEYPAYESAAKSLAANGHDTVEGCYIAGLDPDDPESELRAQIEKDGDMVRISWTPNLNTGAVRRIYRVVGRRRWDSGAWGPAKPRHRFFKVTAAMPMGTDGETTAVSGAGFTEQELGGVQLWENGPYWAECNLGADKPEEYGYYFWWGDVVGYTANTNNATWKLACWHGTTWVSSTGEVMDSSPFSSSTCPIDGMDIPTLRLQGYIDSTGNLVAKYDAATANLGAPWRMPTAADFAALTNNCTTTWTTRNGVYGQLVTGKGAFSTESIFFPATGYGFRDELHNPGTAGDYWSSTPRLDWVGDAWYGGFNYSGFFRNSRSYYGVGSVRPLRGFAE